MPCQIAGRVGRIKRLPHYPSFRMMLGEFDWLHTWTSAVVRESRRPQVRILICAPERHASVTAGGAAAPIRFETACRCGTIKIQGLPAFVWPRMKLRGLFDSEFIIQQAPIMVEEEQWPKFIMSLTET